MSRQINQPINQVRLTNVAVVRMNKGGKRFEIACYRNKVVDYRKGLETDLDEVLQTDRIFTNVSKGQFAKHLDLQKVFGTKNEEAIARIILEKGQLQVSDLERQSQLENTLAQIATWVANHCVHPESQRPYTISQIKHALGKQYQVQPHKPIKKQYLDCVKFLKQVIPIERAKMELALSYQMVEKGGENDNKLVEERVQKELREKDVIVRTKEQIHSNKDEQQQAPITTKCVVLADPSMYRPLDDLAKTLPGGKLEILRQVVTQEGDVDLEMEIERKKQLKQSGQDDKEDKDNSDEDDNDSSSDDNDAAADALAHQLTQKAIISTKNDDKHENGDADADSNNYNSESDSDDDNNNGDNGYVVVQAVPLSRKQQKEKQKQSKKSKRRQREQEAEREERRQAEEKRQQERAARNIEEKIQPVVQANANAASGEAKPCNTCGGNFPNAAAYRAHFKSDWHQFNQKLKLQGMAPVSEEEFKLCDAETFFGGT